jgi:hypothetical protein
MKQVSSSPQASARSSSKQVVKLPDINLAINEQVQDLIDLNTFYPDVARFEQDVLM